MQLQLVEHFTPEAGIRGDVIAIRIHFIPEAQTNEKHLTTFLLYLVARHNATYR